MRFDLANFGETEDLETTAVGQDRVRPIDESMEPAGLLDNLHARTNAQMVGVPKDDLGSHFLKFARIKCLHTSLSADGHENRSIDDAARSRQATETSL